MSLIFHFLLVLGLCLTIVESFVSFRSSSAKLASNVKNCPTTTSCNIPVELHATSTRREILHQSMHISVATLFAGTSVPGPAFAERSLGTVTESYKRYVPRMEAGFAFLAKDLKEMIENGDSYAIVAEITADKGTTLSAMKGTMKIFATAFSDSVLSQSTRELQLAALKTNDELDKIADSMKKGHLDKALDAYRQALFFAQVYSETANACIPRSLAKIKGPNGVGERLVERDPMDISGSF